MLSPAFYSHCKGKSATGKLLPNFMNHDVFAVDVLVAAQLLISLVYSSCKSCKLQLRQLARNKERDTLIQNEIESKEEFLRSMAMVFRDFDQNGNGAISWTDSCLHMLCLAFTYELCLISLNLPNI